MGRNLFRLEFFKNVVEDEYDNYPEEQKLVFSKYINKLPKESKKFIFYKFTHKEPSSTSDESDDSIEKQGGGTEEGEEEEDFTDKFDSQIVCHEQNTDEQKFNHTLTQKL